MLDSGAAFYNGLAWRKDSDDLAVFKSKSDEKFEDDTHILLAWKTLDRKFVFDPSATPGIPGGRRIVSYRSMTWADDGSALFFGIAEWEPKPEKSKDSEKKAAAKTDAPEEEQAEVDVWHARDLHAIPEQKLRADRDRSAICWRRGGRNRAQWLSWEWI